MICLSKIVEESNVDNWMRLCVCKFLERISFDESYIQETKNYNKNKQQIDLSNIFKEIRNSNKVINNKLIKLKKN